MLCERRFVTIACNILVFYVVPRFFLARVCFKPLVNIWVVGSIGFIGYLMAFGSLGFSDKDGLRALVCIDFWVCGAKGV